jgi:hypothetical protein
MRGEREERAHCQEKKETGRKEGQEEMEKAAVYTKHKACAKKKSCTPSSNDNSSTTHRHTSPRITHETASQSLRCSSCGSSGRLRMNTCPNDLSDGASSWAAPPPPPPPAKSCSLAATSRYLRGNRQSRRTQYLKTEQRRVAPTRALVNRIVPPARRTTPTTLGG